MTARTTAEIIELRKYREATPTPLENGADILVNAGEIQSNNEAYALLDAQREAATQEIEVMLTPPTSKEKIEIVSGLMMVMRAAALKEAA